MSTDLYLHLTGRSHLALSPEWRQQAHRGRGSPSPLPFVRQNQTCRKTNWSRAVAVPAGSIGCAVRVAVARLSTLSNETVWRFGKLYSPMPFPSRHQTVVKCVAELILAQGTAQFDRAGARCQVGSRGREKQTSENILVPSSCLTVSPDPCCCRAVPSPA